MNGEDLDRGAVVRMCPIERIEQLVEAKRYRRLQELRMERGKAVRRFDLPAQTHFQALDAFVWGLSLGHHVTLAFSFDELGSFSMRAHFSAEGRNQVDACDAAADLQNGFDAALAAAAITCRFKDETTTDSVESPLAWQADIVPPGLRFNETTRATDYSHSRPSPRLILRSDAAPARHGVVIAQPRTTPFYSLDELLRSLAAAKCATRLVITFRSYVFAAEEIRLIRTLRDKTAEKTSFTSMDGVAYSNSIDIADSIDSFLANFERAGKAIEVSARLAAAIPLSTTILNFTAGVTWGARENSNQQQPSEWDWRRLRPLGYELPQWLPSGAGLEALGVPVKITTPRREPGVGILLGHTTDGDPVRLSMAAKERHVYCCGATGSGKSTLLANMVLQDIEAEHGLILIDPHGDITADVLARIPPKATRRVVAFDLADRDFAPGLNVFDPGCTDPAMAKALVCGELLRIFKYELFQDVPEAFGPMFELYYRNALMLLLDAEGPTTATLADVPRVFQDADYRRLLVECCPNQHVRNFWKKTAERVTYNEIELENIAPYIIAKFEPFLGSLAIRSIVSQPNTTLNFGSFMDEGKTVLISLAKGTLGTNESRVLGLLLLQQIQIACMGRAHMAKSERRPVTLYVDEAQSFIGGALTELLAEARKFALSLVLANQNLAQLSGRTSRGLIDAVLGNVANLLTLRVGIRDAELLEPWFRPHMAVDDLVGMPDFTAAARILDGHRPGVPTVINLPPLPPAGEPAIAKSIIASSRSAYCHRRDEIEAKLSAR